MSEIEGYGIGYRRNALRRLSEALGVPIEYTEVTDDYLEMVTIVCVRTLNDHTKCECIHHQAQCAGCRRPYPCDARRVAELLLARTNSLRMKNIFESDPRIHDTTDGD